METTTTWKSLKTLCTRRVGLLFRLVSWKWPLLAAVLLGVIGYSTHLFIDANLKRQLTEQIRAIRNASVAGLEVWMESQRDMARHLAESPTLNAATRELVGLTAGEEVDRDALRKAPALAHVQARVAPLLKDEGFLGFEVLNTEGTTVASMSSEEVGLQSGLVPLPEIKRAFAGQVVVSEPFRHKRVVRKDGKWYEEFRPVMIAAAPIWGRVNELDVVTAVLALEICPCADFTRILTVARMGESGETYAFNRDGMMLSDSRFDDQLRSMGLIPDVPESMAVLTNQIRDPGGDLTAGYRPTVERKRQPLTRMARAAAAGETGEDVEGYRDYRGVPVIGAWTWLDKYEFGVASEVDVAEAYETVILLRRAFLTLFILIAIGTFGILASLSIIRALRSRVQKITQLGQYTLGEKIGEGGMGEVYRATHALLRRPVAIKLLRATHQGDQAVHRFEREVQLTSSLTHPNTIEIYDFGRTPDNVFYYAMEYLPGVTLEKLIEAEGPQPAGRVAHILMQACGSLAEAHGIGLVHRDIKPANLMLCERGGLFDVIKVLDFGLVKDIGTGADVALTAAHAITGTPLYMSPESIRRDENADHRSDIYSLAAVGYWLLTGRHVFDADQMLEVFNMHLNTAPPPPSVALGRPVEPALEAALLRGLAKDPDDRYPDAAAFADALAETAAAGDWSNARARAAWAAQRASGSAAPSRISEAEIAATLDLDLHRRKSGGDNKNRG